MLAYDFNFCLKKIRNGETQWLEEIYNEYYETMTLTAWNKVKNIETAKDIASNFLKYILENIQEIDYIEYPASWIYTAINNKAIDYIRKNSKIVFIDDIKEDIFAHTVDFELYFAFNKDFKNLTEYEQELVLMHYLHGFKYSEISLKTGKPVGTIKSDISKIKKKLKHLRKYM